MAKKMEMEGDGQISKNREVSRFGKMRDVNRIICGKVKRQRRDKQMDKAKAGREG